MPSVAVSARCSRSATSHRLPIKLIGKEYKVLIAQLESLFLSSSTFTLQTLYYHLHPTIHTMSLLSSLCLSLETEGTSKDVSGESESSDDDFGGKADELGLGGAALKGIMDVMNAKQGVVPGSDIPAGEVIGGEVLGIICERESTMSGYVLALGQV
jgi:gamma-tubulin complex component 2